MNESFKNVVSRFSYKIGVNLSEISFFLIHKKYQMKNIIGL